MGSYDRMTDPDNHVDIMKTLVTFQERGGGGHINVSCSFSRKRWRGGGRSSGEGRGGHINVSCLFSRKRWRGGGEVI